MNTWIWIAIVLIAWTRPIDIYYRRTWTETINGHVYKHVEKDYIKRLAWVLAIAFIVVGLVH